MTPHHFGPERKKEPRKATGGIKARSDNGEFGKNWWAKRWLRAMENLVDVNRLRRGQRYARMGQVLSMVESSGSVILRVQGSRSKPYKVKISLEPLKDEQWEKVLQYLAGQAIFAAQLLVGDMPVNIDEAFASVGVSLFPVRVGDLITECSCPDRVNPCKHIAAAHYILGDRFDEDPFLLFRLRGRTQKQILEGLRRYRSGGAPVDEPADEDILEETEEDEGEEEFDSIQEDLVDFIPMDNFWSQQASLADFEVSIKAPEIALPIFRRLGEPEITSQESLEDLLSNVYHSVSQAAMIIAFHGEEFDDNGQDD